MTASRMMMFLQDMGMGLFRGGAASDEELADPFGDQRRLVLALDLDRKFERLLPLAGALFVEFNELEVAAQTDLTQYLQTEARNLTVGGMKRLEMARALAIRDRKRVV